MATRFRLRLTRPNVQVRLPASLKEVLRLAWDDGAAKLDLSAVVDHEEGLCHLFAEVASLVWEHPEFKALQLGIESVLKHRSIVDRIGWLDDDFQHPVQEIKTSEPHRLRGRLKRKKEGE